MQAQPTTLRPDRAGWHRGTAVALPVALAALALWRPSLDVFNTTKATLIVGGVVVLTGVLAVRALARRQLAWPRGPWMLAASGFILAMLLVTIVGSAPLRSVVGAPGRHGGLALYAACAVLAMTAAGLARDEQRRVVTILLGTSVVVSTYALIQAVGADPLVWFTVEGGVPVFSTFGNVDFASAWLGIVGVLGMGLARGLSPEGPGRWIAWSAVGLAALAATLTGSLQGPVVLAVGGIGHGIAAAHARGAARRRIAATVAGVAVVAGVLAAGPLGGVLGDAGRSLATRIPKWEAALAIAGDTPLLGRGPDTYEDWFFAARTPDVAAEAGLRRSVDNAHNVALHLLAGGGILLAATWLAAVVVVPAVLLRRRLSLLAGDPLALGIALAWLGYLAQSLVSLDVPPLAVLGWLLVGLVVGGGGAVMTRVALPAINRVLVVSIATVLVALALVQVIRPWRADVVGWQAEAARSRGDRATAAALTDSWVGLAPWDSRAPASQGAWLTLLGQLEEALVQQRRARAARPRDLAHALNVARLLAALDRPAEASEAYEEVLVIDPHTPAVLAEVGLHELSAGSAARGRDLLAIAVAGSADPPPEWTAALEGRGAGPPEPVPSEPVPSGPVPSGLGSTSRMEIGQG